MIDIVPVRVARGTGQTGQIYGLDFLRFFAAAIVMLYHLGFVSWASPHNFLRTDTQKLSSLKYMAPAIDTGWVGVQIFFVISGFVIAYTANGTTPLTFLNRRIVRLAPAVWICASLTIPMLLLAGDDGWSVLGKYIGSILFIPFVPKVSLAYWTLPIEVVFYGIIFLLLCYDRFRKIEFMALVLGYTSATIWAVFWLRFVLPLAGLGQGAAMLENNTFAQLLLVNHGVFFAVGLLIWLVSRDGWTFRRIVSGSVFAVAGLLEIAAETAKSSAWTGVAENSFVPAALWIVAVAVIVASIAFNDGFGRRLGPAKRLVRSIGAVTYPLYLIHEPVGGFLIVRLLDAGCPALLALIAASLVCIGAAAIIALQIEPIGQAWTKRWLAAVERHLPCALDRYRNPTAMIPIATK